MLCFAPVFRGCVWYVFCYVGRRLCCCCCRTTHPCLSGGVLPYFEVPGHPVPVSSLGFKCPHYFIWRRSYIVYPSKMPFRDNCIRYFYLCLGFQRLPHARGGTAQKKIIHLANWSQLIHPGPASSLTKFFFWCRVSHACQR